MTAFDLTRAMVAVSVLVTGWLSVVICVLLYVWYCERRG